MGRRGNLLKTDFLEVKIYVCWSPLGVGKILFAQICELALNGISGTHSSGKLKKQEKERRRSSSQTVSKDPKC